MLLFFILAVSAYCVATQGGLGFYEKPRKRESAQKPATAYEHEGEEFEARVIRTSIAHRGERHRSLSATVNTSLSATGSVPYTPLMDIPESHREDAVKSLNIQSRFDHG